MLAKSKQTKIRIVPLARIPHDKPDAPACSSTDFSLCAFPRIQRKSKPHRPMVRQRSPQEPVPLEARMCLSNDVADALACRSTDFSPPPGRPGLSAFPPTPPKPHLHTLN